MHIKYFNHLHCFSVFKYISTCYLIFTFEFNNHDLMILSITYSRILTNLELSTFKRTKH